MVIRFILFSIMIISSSSFRPHISGAGQETEHPNNCVDSLIFHIDDVDEIAVHAPGELSLLVDFNDIFSLCGVNKSDYRTKIIAEFIITDNGNLISPRGFLKMI